MSLFDLGPHLRLDAPLGDPLGQALAICHGLHPDEGRPTLEIRGAGPPGLWDGEELISDDALAIAEALAPEWFGPGARARAEDLRRRTLDAVRQLGGLTDQAAYERAHEALADDLGELDRQLDEQRYLGGAEPDITDLLLFTFSVRLDPVYYELFKASVGLLADFPALEGHARDLYERPAFAGATDFHAIKRRYYRDAPVLNPRGIIPAGGLPDLDAPHFRAEQFAQGPGGEAGTEEAQDARRLDGEWVRPQSRQRDWIRADGAGRYPAEAGRYHLYAPYNCPWSHRALLGRAVKGLEEVVGASVVYFRRDPDRGWQFNPAIPGCTADLAGGRRYVAELYEAVGSSERSVPVLWDTATRTIVSNESAEILRMFNGAFGELARRDLDLYPESHRDAIDRLNEAVYHRVNNGAYKAGFASSQAAYERAFARYFRMLDWLDDRLGEVRWLAGTARPTEADLRLFPTIFRHDAVYYSRFKLNQRRITDLRHLADWLSRMLEVPGVAQASNLDHARNGYFGRTGNEVVPAGPIPLGLSPRDFARDVWLNRA